MVKFSDVPGWFAACPFNHASGSFTPGLYCIACWSTGCPPRSRQLHQTDPSLLSLPLHAYLTQKRCSLHQHAARISDLRFWPKFYCHRSSCGHSAGPCPRKLCQEGASNREYKHTWAYVSGTSAAVKKRTSLSAMPRASWQHRSRTLYPRLHIAVQLFKVTLPPPNLRPAPRKPQIATLILRNKLSKSE